MNSDCGFHWGNPFVSRTLPLYKITLSTVWKYRDKSRYFVIKYKIVANKLSMKGNVASVAWQKGFKPSPLWRRCWAKWSGWGVNFYYFYIIFPLICHLRDIFPTNGKTNSSVTSWHLPFQGRQKSMQRIFYSTNLNNITYNYVPKNAM